MLALFHMPCTKYQAYYLFTHTLTKYTYFIGSKLYKKASKTAFLYPGKSESAIHRKSQVVYDLQNRVTHSQKWMHAGANFGQLKHIYYNFLYLDHTYVIFTFLCDSNKCR